MFRVRTIYELSLRILSYSLIRWFNLVIRWFKWIIERMLWDTNFIDNFISPIFCNGDINSYRINPDGINPGIR